MSIFFWNNWLKRATPARRRNRQHSKSRIRPLRWRRLELEPLEDRVLPANATPTYIIDMPSGGAQPYQFAAPVGFTPQQIQTAYGVSQLYGIVGNGAGQTIAIVDAYDNPSFVDSTNPNFVTSDLHNFDVQFGLPDPPSFKKLDQNGGNNLPGVDPAGKGNPNGNWEVEEALDVEWAHAIAPGANIILFEANTAALSDLFTAVATAAATPGVSVVSQSFGAGEFNGEQGFDSTFTTPAGHQGVTFLASTGDSGSPGGYPAYSPNVIAVGGTSLTLNPNNTYNSESGWSGSGGGISTMEPEPAYQLSVQQTGFRTIPDVAFDADPNTGVAVYDSYNNGNATPWEQIGGTSLACPCWAGLIAIANEGRAQQGEPTLDGPSQTLPELYAIYQSNPSAFHDITTGSNGGFSAGTGYDEVTGMGSPAANILIPDLLGLKVHGNNLGGGVEGQPLNNVAVATFIDPTGSQPVSNYAVTINWGDGSPVTSGIVVANGGNSYTVLGSHTYVNPGVYPFSVLVQNTTNELTGSSSGSVSVADAPLLGSAQVINSQAGAFASNALVAVFTDTDTTIRDPSQYAATVQWSEGNGLSFTSSGSIVRLFGNTFAVYSSAPFSFPVGGLFPVSVHVTDLDGGASVTVNSTVSVAHNPAIPPLVPQDAADATGPVTNQFAAAQDALTNLLTAERLFLVAFAFGTTAEQQHGFANLMNAFTAYQVAIFALDMSLPGS